MRAKSAANLADLHHRWPVFASELVNADIYQELLRPDVVLRARRTYPDGKHIFWRIQL
jgi:hypothetical protein